MFPLKRDGGEEVTPPTHPPTAHQQPHTLTLGGWEKNDAHTHTPHTPHGGSGSPTP